MRSNIDNQSMCFPFDSSWPKLLTSSEIYIVKNKVRSNLYLLFFHEGSANCINFD